MRRAGLEGDVFFFPEQEGVIEPAAVQKIMRDGDRLTISMKPGFSYKPGALESLRGVIATMDAAAVRVCLNRAKR